jgi:hypothetical protein
MKQLLLRLALAVLCAACGGSSSSGGLRIKSGEPAASVFELGELTMFDGEDAVFKVHADGSTEMGFHHGENITITPGKPFSSKDLPIVMKPGPSIAADGTFTWKGKPVAKVNVDGTVTDLTNNTVVDGIKVTGEAIQLQAPGGMEVTLALAADGKLTQQGGGDLSEKPLRVAGADTPGKRRAILAIVGLTLMPKKKHVDRPAVTDEATPPSP